MVMPGSAGQHAALQVVVEARGLQPCHRIPLWEVVDEPQGWPNLSPHSKVCEALVLITEWLWVYSRQSASILIFVARDSEVFRMRQTILFSPKLNNVHWSFEVMELWGQCPRHVESDVRVRMAEDGGHPKSLHCSRAETSRAKMGGHPK